MSAELLVRDALLAYRPLALLVVDRVHPVKMPQGGKVPAIVYSRSGNAPVQSMEGDTSKLDQVRIRLACHADAYETVKKIAKQVRVAMRALNSTCASDIDIYDDTTQTHSVALDFYVWETLD